MTEFVRDDCTDEILVPRRREQRVRAVPGRARELYLTTSRTQGTDTMTVPSKSLTPRAIRPQSTRPSGRSCDDRITTTSAT